MITYLILTPQGEPDRDHRRTRFIADRFSWLAFVFPGLWLLFHRCWLIGTTALLAQILAAWLVDQPGLFWAGTLSEVAIGLLIGLEGRHIHAQNLMAKGWSMAGVVTAPDLATAEAIFFAGLPTDPVKPSLPVTDWTKLSTPGQASLRNGPALGLFDMGGGR
ncbi:DUF2628 domain-containing protein [Rhizobium sp. FY34]|uniref:DUF2628 domain-containing protein n=1 Tax=Rhizobium sp. FY34 TaxID=2562309 RepID=UPI0014852DED|nr:DUF2628 domain-containing protein [Rhizobium sp. FY34]